MNKYNINDNNVIIIPLSINEDIKENIIRSSKYKGYTINNKFKVYNDISALNNDCDNFIVNVHNIFFNSTLALYLALKFNNFPDLQTQIINQRNIKTQLNIAKNNKSRVRNDWQHIKDDVMYYCILLKYLQNQQNFGQILIRTNNKIIIKKSLDRYWGVFNDNNDNNNTLIGYNKLGIILSNIRNDIINNRININDINNKIMTLKLKLINKDIKDIITY